MIYRLGCETAHCRLGSESLVDKMRFGGGRKERERERERERKRERERERERQ